MKDRKMKVTSSRDVTHLFEDVSLRSLKTTVESLQQKYGDDASITVESEPVPYEDYYEAVVYLVTERLETDKEMEGRILREKRMRQHQKDKELQLLEQLKQKYEDKE